jgi:hypothetical protein
LIAKIQLSLYDKIYLLAEDNLEQCFFFRKALKEVARQNMLGGVFVWIIKYDSVDLKDQIMKGTAILVR